MCGASGTRETPTWSRCTSATCGARWMPRSAPSASRPCASGLPRRRHLIAEGSGRLPWRGSLRLRITLLTALVVALVVALGGSLILLSLESELIGAADAAAKDRAQQTPRQAAAGTLPASPPAMENPETPSEIVSGGQLVTATAGQDRGHRPHAPIGGARFMVVLPIQPETPADRGEASALGQSRPPDPRNGYRLC
jgi:hypothetical protein